MQYWDCADCGTQAIAGTIENCPVCGAPRAEAQDVSAAESGASPATGQAGPDQPQALDEGDWSHPDA